MRKNSVHYNEEDLEQGPVFIEDLLTPQAASESVGREPGLGQIYFRECQAPMHTWPFTHA